MLLLRFQLSCGKCVKHRFIEFFVFDYGSLPYLLSLFSWMGATFPLIALNKNLFSLWPRNKCWSLILQNTRQTTGKHHNTKQYSLIYRYAHTEEKIGRYSIEKRSSYSCRKCKQTREVHVTSEISNSILSIQSPKTEWSLYSQREKGFLQSLLGDT